MSLKIPQSVAELITDPRQIKEAFAELIALRNLNVQLVAAQGAVSLAPNQRNILGDAPNLILPLPLKLGRPIADSTATAASVSTALNLLLAELRKTGQLPG